MKRKRRINRADASPPTQKAQQLKVRKLMEMAKDLENGGHFNVTRLSAIKTLCQDVKTAARFVMHLAQRSQTRRDFGGDHKYYPAATVKQHRELAAEAFTEIEAYLKRRSEGREDRLRDLLREAREANNEYRNIPYGVVREIKSQRMLMVENAIYCTLAYDHTIAGHYAYQAARNYAELYDPHYGSGLIPASAPFVAEIAAFWHAHYFDEPAADKSAA